MQQFIAKKEGGHSSAVAVLRKEKKIEIGTAGQWLCRTRSKEEGIIFLGMHFLYFRQKSIIP
jgi:hypothetical protein